MKHLRLILMRYYPNRLFRLAEIYQSDEVYNVPVEYQLRIEDICEEHFISFQQLEDFVYQLCGER